MAFRWTHPPRVVGHRGAPRDARENTMDAFHAAQRQGALAVELDARLSKDGVVVVHHDAALGRVFEGDAGIEEMDAAALQALGIPTLADVLALGLLVDVEIKADAANAAQLPEAVLADVRRANALERALVTSFDPELADAYARLSGRPAGAILPFAPEPEDLSSWPRLPFVALVDDAAEQEVLDMLRAHGKTTLVWTVNDPARAVALWRAGVAGVITDRPGPLRAAEAGSGA